MQKTKAQTPDLRKQLFAIKNNAVATKIITPTIGLTLDAMIICMGPNPTSTIASAQVQYLADFRGVSERSIRAHIAELIRLGLARDRRLGGGHRRLTRKQDGSVLIAAGICLQPLLEKAASIRRSMQEHAKRSQKARQLRANISSLRNRIKAAINKRSGRPPLPHYDNGPRRNAALSIEQLEKLKTGLQNEVDGLERSLAQSKEASDYPEEIDRPINKPNTNSLYVKRSKKEQHGFENVTPADVGELLPFDWKLSLAEIGGFSWENLERVAWQKAREFGADDRNIQMLVQNFGPITWAVLVLYADANSCRRGGSIVQPKPWLRSMANFAEKKNLRLDRNIHAFSRRLQRNKHEREIDKIKDPAFI